MKYDSELSKLKSLVSERTWELLKSYNAVYKNQYDSTGLDEDNTFALYTPSAEFTINVVNPALFGKFKLDQKYYVDFTEAE